MGKRDIDKFYLDKYCCPFLFIVDWNIVIIFGVHFHFSLQKDLLSIVFSLLMAVVPVFLVMCAFRYGMLEEFGKKSFLSELTTHLPLLIIWMSVPSIGLDRLEGKTIGRFM